MAATTSGVISDVQYEDLTPKSELKVENAAYVFHIHLPDFKKEQLKITYEDSTRIIKVTGERQIAPTKWARFNQTYAVIPENCLGNDIHAKFADGILTITLPKSNVAQPTLPIQDSKLQEATTTTTDGPEATTRTTPKPAPATPQPATSTPPPTNNIPAPPRTMTEGEEKMGQDETRKPDVPGAPSPREVLKEAEPNMVQEEPAPLKTSPSSSSSKVDGLVKEKEENASKGKNEEPEEIGKKRTESPPPSVPLHGDTGSTKTGRKSSTSGTIKEEEQDKKPRCYCKEELVSGILLKEVKKSVAAAAKEAAKGLAMAISEDKQRMVNIGVAVVVISAVGAEDGADEHGEEGASRGRVGVLESVEGDGAEDLACIMEVAIGECPMDVVHSLDEVVGGAVDVHEDIVANDDGLDLCRRVVGDDDPLDPEVGEGLGLGGGEDELVGEVDGDLDAGGGEGFEVDGVGVIDFDTFHFQGFEEGHQLCR